MEALSSCAMHLALTKISPLCPHGPYQSEQANTPFKGHTLSRSTRSMSVIMGSETFALSDAQWNEIVEGMGS